MLSSKTVSLCCLLGMSVVSVPAALAQTYCFPRAVGVPFLSGPPTTAADPRWDGALAVGKQDNLAEHRALTYVDGAQKYLVLMWRAEGDFGGSTPDDQDLVTVQFIDDSTSPPTGNLIRLKRTTSVNGTGGTVAGGKLAAQIYHYTGTLTIPNWGLLASQGFGSDLGTMPTWLQNDALVDLVCSPFGCSRWTVTLKIPLSATATPADPATGLKLPAKFRYSYEVDMQHQDGMGGIYVEPPILWPEGVTPIDFTAPIFPTPSTLAMAQPHGGPDPCATGISLGWGQVTVEHGSPAVVGTQIALNQANTFRAQPTNGLAVAIPRSTLEASFRIADWGTSIGSSPLWSTVPGCSAAHDLGSGNVASGGQFNLECSWTLSAAEQCKYGRAQMPAGACDTFPSGDDRNQHQCVFAELRPAPGATLPPGFFFSRQSSYQNMDFVLASEVSQKVKLELRSLSAGAFKAKQLPKARDLYVYVETRNMPAPPSTATAARPITAVLTKADVLKTMQDTKLANKLRELKVQDGNVGAAVSSLLQEHLRSGKIKQELIAEILPTYVAHVWQDTGRTTSVGGKTAKIISSAPSFGYFIAHDGAAVGWKLGLAGKNVKEIGKNLYRISVPTKGGSQGAEAWVRACEDIRCLKTTAAPKGTNGAKDPSPAEKKPEK